MQYQLLALQFASLYLQQALALMQYQLLALQLASLYLQQH